MTQSSRKIIGAWLLLGCGMVFFQVIIGGVTRLTESGLSITEWKPIKGIIPPVNESEWQAEFERYRQIAQYKTINEGMTLEEFKWIYFWEYLHRFWARLMGFVFIIPFSFFILKKWLDKEFFKKIGVLFIWGGAIGAYGWIMVKSGLTGMYVPPVHLSIHLILALSLFGYLVYITLFVYKPGALINSSSGTFTTRRLLVIIMLLLFTQIFFGGIVSGMKAGLAYPTWPDMNGEWIPAALYSEKVSLVGFMNYNSQDFWGRTAIQFIHRLTAYVLAVLVLVYYIQARPLSSNKNFKLSLLLLPLFVFVQAAIGIITVLNCVGQIPVFWGVLHQAGAMLLIAASVSNYYFLTSTHPTSAS